MCIYTVRSLNGENESIYYDPSPECYGHHIPKCIRDLGKPKIRRTRAYGTASMFEDCMYQCFKYMIALHTNEIQFTPKNYEY